MEVLLLLNFLVLLSAPSWATERHYYIAIEETTWDYAPSGKKSLFLLDREFRSKTYLQRDRDRIGSVYKKALYFQYTDDTFKTIIEKPSWLGYLGPIIQGETGDMIHVHVKNNASRAYTVHPHGVTYRKEYEGALYPDNTSGLQREDDRLAPGARYTYSWFVEEKQGPGPSDSNCVTRIYHSHLETVSDMASGLIGPLIICKRGTLTGDREKDIDKSFFLLLSITDENESWYIDDNIKAYTDSARVNKSDPGFRDSNLMPSINGYMYGNLPNLTMCVGDRVRWFLVGMGGVTDTHPVYFHGQTLISQNQRQDTIALFPSSLEDASMVAQGPGEWLLGCAVHGKDSMQAFFNVRNCRKPSTVATETRILHYYIAAEEIFWNYAPSGVDLFTGKNITAPGSKSRLYFEQSPARIGGTYKKIVYREYTDASFQTQKAREEHLGILGPVLKAEVGQALRVTFSNRASVPLSIQPQGLRYNKSNEGSFYPTSGGSTPPPSSHVNPGSTFVYTWEVPEDVGPTAMDPQCLTWLYYSSVHHKRDTNSGLVGPLLVCRAGSLGEDGRQKGIDKEFYILATIFDENESYLLDANIRTFTTEPEKVDKEDPDFQDSNLMSSLNGYMYGNLPGLVMCAGDNVSWHILSVGTEKDLHGIYFQGNTFISSGSRKDTEVIIPHTSNTLLMTPDSIGTFDLVCMTAEHYQGGMRHKYQVQSCSERNPKEAQFQEERVVYITAEEIEWDYSPSKKWQRELKYLQRENKTSMFIDRVGASLGSKYKKVIYRQYEDITFTKQTVRNENETHLDILGPLLLLSPGQVLRVVFKNKASRPYSVHAHGVRTSYSTVAPAQPGEIQTYIWEVPERTGPTSMNFECIPWFYYSTVDAVKDLFSGLIGPLIVCRKDAKANLVHRVLLFMTFDENKSWYLEENINTHSAEPSQVNKSDDNFQLSNLMHAINGRLFGNNQGLTFHVGDEVNFYLISIGGESDLHTAHFHGHSFEYMDSGLYRSDVYNLPPGVFRTVKMYPRDVGTWLFHCHVTDHIIAGMESTYTVIE
ncbi:ceruloplasmin-like [Sorex araneus]|uniref:ceruloplasmin-like n=1 Tax=Sorex araneus TaxID=42254 RepID=UPI002433AE56|nr:ceruloplasmin-like [Sorex araneus]